MGAALGRRLLRLALEQDLGHVIPAASVVVEPLVTTGKKRLRVTQACSIGCSLAVSAKNAD
jgi:hypothetical protein